MSSVQRVFVAFVALQTLDLRFNVVNFAKLLTHGSTFSCGSLPISNCNVFATAIHFHQKTQQTHTGITHICQSNSRSEFTLKRPDPKLAQYSVELWRLCVKYGRVGVMGLVGEGSSS